MSDARGILALEHASSRNNGIESSYPSARDATPDDGRIFRRGARMKILFLLFSERDHHPRARVHSRREEILHACWRVCSNKDRPKSPNPERSLTHATASAPHFVDCCNCCPPRDFCVVEKRTLLLRLLERPGRPRFVNNSLINMFLIVLE